MSCDVKVSGIPTLVKLGRLIPLFSNILSLRSSDFRLRILPSRGLVKDVLLSLPTYSEAELAQEKLDNFVYKFNNKTYIFAAEISDNKQIYRKPKPRAKFQNYNIRQSYGSQIEEGYQGSDRSHSPHYGDTFSQLDVQLEILRKQRMILEEERKLLEEQRKLDQFKMKSLHTEVPSVSNRNSEDNKMLRPSSITSETKYETMTQRIIQHASKSLKRRLNMLIQKHSSLKERMALSTHVRSIIKQRMAAMVAADGQGVFYTNKLITLYRSQYPPSEDEELVKEALKYVKEGHRIDDSEAEEAKTKPDGTESSPGEHTFKEENAVTKDTTVSGNTNISENTNVKGVKKFEEKRLFFHKASGVLIRKMNTHMDKYSPPESRRFLVEYLRFTLKQRLGSIIAGQPIYQTYRIVKMYRSLHPVTEDEELVKQLLKDIEEECIPEDILDKIKEANARDIKKYINTQDNILTGGERTDETGQPEMKKDTDVSENIKNEVNINKDIHNEEESLKHLDNCNNEKDDMVSGIRNEYDVDNMEKVDEIVDDDLQNNSNHNNSEKDNEKFNVCGTSNSESLATEATEECSDTLEIKAEEENQGIKRKNTEVEDSLIKIAKIDNADNEVEIGQEMVG